ncbi:MAG: ABC transporter permease [Nocardioides sp.]
MERRHLALIALAAIPVTVLAIFFVLPVTGMVGRGFRPEGHWDLVGVLDVLKRPRVHRVLWFTVWSSAVATSLTLVLGLPAAYVLHRLAFPLRRLVRAALLVPFVLPTVVVGVAFRELLTGPLAWLDLDGTPAAIIAGLVFFNVAVVIRAVGSAWESLDHRPAEAAAALGAGPWAVFRTVTLPALRPAIVGAASVVFLFCATAFGVVLTLGGLRYASVETEIYLLTTNLLDLQGAAALSILQLAVVTLLLAIGSRLRPTPTAVTRVPPRPRRPRLADLPQILVTVALLAFVAAPILALVVGSLQDADGHWTMANYRALNTLGTHQALVEPVTTALDLSLRIAIDATLLSVILGLLVALSVTRRAHTRAERRVRGALDALFMLPLGVSAVTLGFGFLVTLGRPPLNFRDSPWLVPIAQALVALPLVVRTLVPALQGIDDRQRQAAASLGAGPLRRLVVVEVPVLFRPVLAAAGFAFAVSLGEFGATSFLARDENATLPVVIFRLIGHPGPMNYGMALAASCVLAATTAAVMLVVERVRAPLLGGVL